MNIFKKIWKELKNLRGHPLTRATEELKQAVMAHCRVVSDVKFHQMMYDFYNVQTLGLNPHEHWWEFAAAKDSAQHHQKELEFEQRKQEQTKARLEACKERVSMIRQGVIDD